MPLASWYFSKGMSGVEPAPARVPGSESNSRVTASEYLVLVARMARILARASPAVKAQARDFAGAWPVRLLTRRAGLGYSQAHLMTYLRALTVAVLAAAVLYPVAAQAQPTDAQKREAKDLNEKATRLYEVGKYGEAIEEYQKVYLLVDDPVLLYNIAQSYRLWGKPEDSARFYRNYLRRAPNAPNRADVEKKNRRPGPPGEEKRRSPVTPTPPVTTTRPWTPPLRSRHRR